MLNRIGVNARVEPLTTGTAAINYLAGNKPYNDRAKYPLPRVVFLDMKMPDISGLDVLRWISSQPDLRRLVVLVHSGYAGTKQIESRSRSKTRSGVYVKASKLYQSKSLT